MLNIEDITSPDIVKEVAKVVANYQQTGELPEQKQLQQLSEAYKQHLGFRQTSSLLDKLTKAYSDRHGNTGAN
jgi:hypothetical protein